jgi:selenide,water dikinase
VIATASKRGLAAEADVQASITSMLELNSGACEAMLAFDVHACTDVTGFGLIGHALEVARASGVSLEIDSAQVRFLPGAVDYAHKGALAGGLKNNRAYASCDVALREGIAEQIVSLLYDPQTSGGLLISLPENDAEQFMSRLETAYRIGRVLARAEQPLLVL